MSELWHIRRETASTYCLYAAVAAMPFSIYVCHLSLIGFLVLWLFEKQLWVKLQSTKNDYQLMALALFAIALLGSISYSQNKSEAWFAMEKKAFFFLLPFAFATSSIISPHLSKKLLTIFCWSCFLALLICYVIAFQRVELFHDGKIGTDSINYLSSSDFWIDHAGTSKDWMFFSYVGLSSGIHMHPTYLALYAALCCVILINRYLQANVKRSHQIVHFALIIFFSVSIIFLAARIVLLMLGVLYAGILCYQMVQAKTKTRLALMLVALIIMLIAGVLLNPVTRYRQVAEITLNGLSVSPNKNYTNSTGIRASLWWLSGQAYLNSNLLFGVGSGDVEESVRQMGENFGITNVLDSYNPHNEYLHILLSTGIIGFTFFLIFVGIGLVKARRNRDIIFLNFLMLFMVVCLTESALELQKGIIFFSVFFSCLSFQKPKSEEVQTRFTIASAAR